MIGVKTIAACMTAGALGAGAIIGAQPAQADPGWPATTDIQWGGTNCIVIESAYQLAPHLAGPSTACGGTWEFSEGNIWAGDLFGADPIMGSADWIACQVYRGGMLVYSDYASAGDGTDVNCLRRAY